MCVLMSGIGIRRASGQALHVGHADPKKALLELQTEQTTVGDAQGRAGRLAEVRGQHGLGAVPGP